MDELEDFWVHTITVETYLGEGGNGVAYAAPVDVPCFIDGGTKIARTATGEQLVVAAPVYAPPEHAGTLTAGSKVTVRGRPARILAATVYDSGSLDLPDHVQIALT
ncbi:hypothetical protein [Curtobacterium sp. MCBA15_012]|uniref:hypothetical protein n=1 Tax=Curtobacterium sp. MCBA15_012 TaxID=1898738 RepID=UPI0008DDEE21|nr:hypothetical protein [Curtobacterium sp. MCBA15_012]WIA99743.1 hypothetical protein QOL15_14710 [Curtobacterium sp. MCBA15_012]